MSTRTAKQLAKLLKRYNEAYYNGEPLVTDFEYDQLSAEYTSRTGEVFTTATAPPADKVRVNLPVHMGGTNKFKHDDDPQALSRFGSGCRTFHVTAKIDGTAALVQLTPDGLRAYTRGDYSTGFEITDILRVVLRDVRPRLSDDHPAWLIRGELTIPIEVFAEKYSSEYTSPRALVNGVVNAKTRNPEVLQDIVFIAFEVLNQPRSKHSNQHKWLKHHGFTVATSLTLDRLSAETLGKLYQRISDSSQYVLDGLVVYRDDREYPICTDKNPEYSIAYKPPTVAVTVTVRTVEWTPTRYGKLKPVVLFDTVELAGSMVSRATAHNARYVVGHGIGPGAVISVTKSNEVIPYIVSVDQPTTPGLPDTSEAPGWSWCPNEVDILASDVTSDTTVLTKQITHFLKSCGVKGISNATVRTILESGHVEVSGDASVVIPRFLELTVDSLMGIPGFQQTKAQSTVNALKTLTSGVSLVDIATGSPYFPHGFGKRKFRAILETIPEFSGETTSEELSQVPGISETSSEVLVRVLPAFFAWVDKMVQDGVITLERPTVRSVHLSASRFGSIVFTGFRDPVLEAFIVKHGGRVTTTVSSKTQMVLTAGDKRTAKTTKAESMGIPVRSFTSFMMEYCHG